MEYCGICRGARVVRHAWQSQLVEAGPSDIASAPKEITIRTYPCPNCAPQDSIDHVAVIDVQSRAVLQYEGCEGFEDHIYHRLVDEIAHELKKGGYVKFTKGKKDTRECTREWRAKLGVVSPAQVATMEQRVAQRQRVVAERLVVEAEKEINNWGSRYETISKERAVIFWREALDRVLKDM